MHALLKVVKENMDYVELKRMDRMASGIDVTFICKASSIEAITTMQDAIVAFSSNTTVSVVDQPDLIV